MNGDTRDPTPPTNGGTTEPQSSQPEWIPEGYRDNPQRLIEEWRTSREELERVKPVAEWWKSNEAWFRAHPDYQFVDSNDYRAFEASRRGGQPQPQTQAQPTPSSQEIDWDDPSAARRAYDTLMQQMDSRLREMDTKHAGTVQEFEKARDNLIELITYQNTLYELERDDLHDFLGNSDMKFKPRVNAREVVDHASKNGLRDLRAAARELYEPQRLQYRDQTNYERGKRDAMQELQARYSTTERSNGVPVRNGVQREGNPVRGYGSAGREDVLARMQEAMDRRAG